MSCHPARRRGPAALATILIAVLLPAAAASAHTVVPGESFWSISQANGVSMDTLAAANGTSIDSTILPGQSLYVPAATVATTTASTATGTGSTGYASSAPGMTPVSGPSGTTYLSSSAAQQLAALRTQSVQQLGVDVYPAGPLSGYRTYAQQAELYRQYLAGEGPVAAPPGTSAHEMGRALDVATPSGVQAVESIGAPYGWQKIDAPTEWWHVSYTGP